MQMQSSVSTEKGKIFTTVGMAYIALFTAVTCILAPLSVPVGPVPISLTNLVIYFSAYILEWKRGTISYILYLLIGMVGLPVFSGFTGGVSKLAGPTGGYLIGFIFMALLCGGVADLCSGKRVPFVLAMVVGTITAYLFGTVWFCFSTGSTVMAALGVCVFPFIPGDMLKMAAAAAFGPMVKRQLKIQ